MLFQCHSAVEKRRAPGGRAEAISYLVYIHLTARDLRQAADRHPIAALIKRVEDLLPNVQLPFQYPPGQRFA